jgi:hypothetical protein
MNWDSISARTTYVMWSDECLWNDGYSKEYAFPIVFITQQDLSIMTFCGLEKLYS